MPEEDVDKDSPGCLFDPVQHQCMSRLHDVALKTIKLGGDLFSYAGAAKIPEVRSKEFEHLASGVAVGIFSGGRIELGLQLSRPRFEPNQPAESLCIRDECCSRSRHGLRRPLLDHGER